MVMFMRAIAHHKGLRPIFIVVAVCPTYKRLLRHIVGTPASSEIVGVDSVRERVTVGVTRSSARLDALQRVVEGIWDGKLGLLAAREVGRRVEEGAGDPRLVGQVASAIT